jgi:hypothetical protein
LLYLRCLLFLLGWSGSFVAWEYLWSQIRIHGQRSLVHHHHLHEHFIHLLSLSRIIALVLRHHFLEIHHHLLHHQIIPLIILSISSRIKPLFSKWLHFCPFFVLIPFNLSSDPSIHISPGVRCPCLILIILFFFFLVIIDIDSLYFPDSLGSFRLNRSTSLLLPLLFGSHLGCSGGSIVFRVHVYDNV